jgi:acyl carrier protein
MKLLASIAERESPMDENAIRNNIKQTIARITGIPVEQISDTASYDYDLGLDSLSKMEIVVDAEMCLRVKIPDERLSEIKTVDDAVRIVSEYLAVAAKA